MAEFDPNQYFRSRLAGANLPKMASIEEARAAKIQKLDEYSKAVANGQAFLEPDRSVGDVVGDVAITGLKSAIGLTEGFVGLADIVTGGQAGKILENQDGAIGYRPKQAKELLDSWLSDAQKEANKKVELADGFVGTLEAAIENPSTIATAVGESAASILGGAAVARGAMKAAQLAGKAGKLSPVVAGALGEGVFGAGSAAEGIRQESADGLLSGKQTAAALASGAGTAILGFAGGKLAQKMGLPDVDTMMASGELKSPAGFLKAVVGAGISEGAFEEMPQSAQEQIWNNYALDKPLTEGVGEAAAMGLVTGVAMGGIGGGLSGAANLADDAKQRFEAQAKTEAAKAEAAKTGDVSAMVKPGSESYAPTKALDALLANTTQEGTSPEQREVNLQKAGEVVARLEAERNVLMKAAGSASEKQAQLAEYRAELASVPADSEDAADLRDAISALEKQLAKPVDAKAQARVKSKVAELDSQLAKARESYKALTDVVLTPEVAKASIEQVSTGKADDETAQKAVGRVLSMAVNSPDLLDLDTVKSLVSDKNNALNADQRQYLSAFAESRAAVAALKDAEEVHQDVLYGGEGFVGISQYRESIQNALKAQDFKQARRLVGQLASFAAGHTDKAAAASNAMASGIGTPIAKIDGTWKVLPRGTRDGQVSAAEFKVMNSGKLVQYIQDEAKAINAALAEMTAAMNVFSVPSGAVNVTNASQQGTATKASGKRQAPEAGGSGKDGKAVSSKLDDSGSAAAQERAAAVVEPTGVTIPDAIARLSDTDLNDQLNDAMAKPDYQKSVRFQQLDAEMSRRESLYVDQENSVLSVSAESSSLSKTSVEPIGDADATEQTEALPDGKLSGFAQEHPEGASVSLSKHFIQTAKQSGDKTGRPLATVGNWLSNLVASKTFTDDFISGVDFSGEQGAAKSRAIEGFVKKAQKWQGMIKKNLPAKRKQVGWEHQDLTSILLTGEDGQLDLEENVKTAISYAVFSWAAREATASHTNDAKTINGILGRSSKQAVSPAAREALTYVGSHQHLVIDSLGSAVMNALGLKAKADAPKNFEANLKVALGTHAMQLAVDAGLMVRQSIPAKQLQALREEGLDQVSLTKVQEKYGEAKDDAVSWFVKVARQEDNKVVPAVQEIFDSNKGSGGVLDRMFKTEAGTLYPSFEPITSVKETTGKGMQRIPAFLKKVLLKNQASPRVIRKDPLFVLDLFTEEEQHALVGVQPEDNATTHRAHWESVEAKNAGLIRQLQNFKEFVTNELEQMPQKLDTPFYLPFNAWQQQRVGIESTVVNPQASKIVRFLVGSPEWKVTLDGNDEEAMTSFTLRVGEGLGVKTERMTVDAAVEAVTNKLNEDVFYDGILALRKAIVRKESISDAEKQQILAAVKAGKGNLHSLDALIAVAHQQEAEAKANGGAYTFETELMGEVDGVANGTMLNHVLLGAKHTADELAEFLEQGGFYTDSSLVNQYNDYRGGGVGFDIYESTALKIHERMQLQLAGWAELEDFQAIGGKLVDADGKIDRDLVKEALNPLAFGSSMGNVIRGMSDNFLDKVYVGFEKLAEKKASQADVDVYVQHVNALIEQESAQLPVGKPLSFYMGYTLKPGAVRSLQKMYKNTIGKVVKEVISTEFAAFLESRDALVQTTNQTYQLYEAVRSGVREVFMNELADAGELPLGVPNQKTGERKIIGDLSKKQEEALEKRMLSIAPTLRTPMSIPDNNKMSDLLMAKIERKQGPADLYQSEIRMSSVDSGKGRSTRVNALITSLTNPGVLMGSASTHATDSAIAHAVQADFDVLNVHDAEISGLGNIKEVAQLLNKQTFEKTLNYSPLSEAYLSLASMIQGIAKNTEKFGMYPEVVRNLQSTIEEIEQKAGGKLEDVLAAAKKQAFTADKTKLEAMSRMVSVDQYAFAGGNYEVTDEDRARAKKLLQDLSQDVPAEVLSAMASIRKALADGYAAPAAQQQEGDAPAEGETDEEAEFIEQGEAEDNDKFEPKLSNGAAAQVLYTIGTETALAVLDKLKTPGTDLVKALAALPSAEASALRTAIAAQLDASKPEFWGKLGTSPVQADPALVAFLESTAKPTTGQVLDFLSEHMKTLNQTRHVQFQRLLVDQLKNTVDLSLPVQYVTPSTPPSLAVHTPPGAARGWYVSNGEGIFVLSPEFKASAITPEILVHEMVHAALLEAVANPNKRTQGMINELNRLYQQAKSMVESAGLKKHSLAVTDLDEFIAWGMTNREFQKDVLSKLSMGSRTKANKLITGMKEFINKVTGILFAGSAMSESEQARNGVAVLVSNVSGLFAEVAQQQQKKTERSNKAEARVLKMAERIRSYSTQDLFESLNAGNISSSFQQHLSNLLNGMVSKLHGPAGALKAELMQDQALSPLDVWLKALNTNEAPFASEVVNAGLANESEQQAFVISQVEATVRTALDGNESQTKLVYGALNKLYTEASNKISVSDFVSAGFTEEQYAFIFTPTKSVGDRSDYMSRFAALGLAHEGFNKLLDFATDTKEKEAKTLAEKVQRVFEQILDFFQKSMTGAWGGQQANNKLQVLVTKLVDIEAAHRRRQISRSVNDSLLSGVDAGVQKGFDYLREKAIAASKSDMIRKHGSGYVRGAGALAGAIAGDRLEAMLKVVQQIRDKEMAKRPGVMAGLLNEVIGSKEALQKLTRAKTNHDRKRKAIMTNTAKTVLHSFANAGADLTKADKDSLTAAFLRTGVHHLVGTKSMQELETLLGKGKALNDAIEAAEQALGAFGKRSPYFINQANVLGYYAATGKVADASMMMNAHNIAEMVGTPYYGQLPKDKVDAAVPLINQLVSLYALRYADNKVVTKARAVLQKELARTDGMNGVELIVRLHKEMEEESLNKLFKGNPSLMVFGYTPDIYNPHIGLAVANEEEGKQLELQGYKRVGQAQNDPSDPDTDTKHLYAMRDGGLQPYLAGAFNLAGMKAKGSKLHSGYMNLRNSEGTMNASLHASVTNSPARIAAMRRMFQAGPVTDLSKVKTTFMAPVVNEKGDIVNWRYLMTHQSKDALLERTNGFDKVLGTLAATTYDKANAKEQNMDVLKALKAMYDEEGTKEPHAYIEVSSDTPDAEMREIWNMLPKETKQMVREAWGKDSLMVRKDSLDLVFGYRKLSLSKAFEKDAKARNELEKLMVFSLEYPMYLAYKKQGDTDQQAREKASARSASAVRKGEHMWQELVREAKDIIVVKTGVVLLGNVISNLSLLWAQGVPLRDMLHHHLVAMRGATAYLHDTEELARLQILVDSGMGGAEEEALRNQITRLEDSLARNPVGELIEAGLMPSIVEDVAADDDPYSYKSALVRKTERYAQGLNKHVVSGARIGYMAHDTKLYQGLSRATQLSDFVARYTLYQHLTDQKTGAMGKEAAVQAASEAFVNYDIPMHRVMQYMDDMGLMMFTKYFLRIQRVIQKMLKDHPGRVLTLAAVNGFHDLGPIVLDSSAVFRIGNNPFSSGPLTLLESLDELATVTAPMSLIK